MARSIKAAGAPSFVRPASGSPCRRILAACSLQRPNESFGLPHPSILHILSIAIPASLVCVRGRRGAQTPGGFAIYKQEKFGDGRHFKGGRLIVRSFGCRRFYFQFRCRNTRARFRGSRRGSSDPSLNDKCSQPAERGVILREHRSASQSFGNYRPKIARQFRDENRRDQTPAGIDD